MIRDMGQDLYLQAVCDRLRQDGFELANDKIDEFDVVVATRRQFKLSCTASWMNIFAIMSVSNSVLRDVIENFSKISLDYAIKNKKGLPRGFQAGVVSFALLVSSNIDEDAKQWVQQRPKKRFAAFEMPVIFNLVNNEIYYYNRIPISGALYYKFFRNSLEKYFK